MLRIWSYQGKVRTDKLLGHSLLVNRHFPDSDLRLAAAEQATVANKGTKHERRDWAEMSYFKPLRRKIGVVTLVLACLFAAGWVRSRLVGDFVDFRVGESSIDLFASYDRAIYWQRVHDKDPEIRRQCLGRWETEAVSENAYPMLSVAGLNWRWRFCGIGVREFRSPRSDLRILVIPYWSIVIPLTFVSAVMLLSKPRVKPSSAPTDV